MKFFILAFCFVSLLFMTGCLDDDNPTPQQPVAFVSIYHASPDAGDVDIIVSSGTINNTPFEYGDYTGYLPFSPGKREFKVSEAGKASAVLIDTAFQFVDSRTYSVFIADSLLSIEAIVLGDSAATPGDGKAMVRFVHLSPDAPGVNVLADDTDLFSDVSFKEGTEFKEIGAGNLEIKFQDVEGDNEVLYTESDMKFEAGQFYTIVLKGFLTPPDDNENEIDADLVKL